MLKYSQELFDLILANIHCGIIISDDQNHVQHVNHAFEKMTGYSTDEVIGRDPEILVSGQKDTAIISSIRDFSNNEISWQEKTAIRHKSGKTRNYHISIHSLSEKTGHPFNYVVIIRDITEQKDSNREIEHAIQHDILTGLPDKYLFLDRLSQNIVSSKRENKSVAILILGIDHFSMINDGLGHAFGDLLLKDFALRLKACFRGSDTVARTESDCFGIVLQMTATNDGVTVAEKILSTIKKPFTIREQEVTIAASIGISLYPHDDENAHNLVKHAESAMHHSKKEGGNKYQFFANEMNLKAKKRIEIESNLRKAIDDKQFILYYQPKVNAETHQIVGMEALMRWLHPENGIISPAVFIPVAEETGLIEPIGLWGLHEACRQNKRWQDEGLRPIRVSVNVSGRQFHASDIVEKVKAALEHSGLSSHYLELEITESLLMHNTDESINKLQQIRNLGCHISIDDFGTGYSSLSYLTRFPITTLKIDRTFIKDIETSRNSGEIARAIIGLSEGLKMEVIAEGAENLEHINFLRQNGCNTVQGFYYSGPVPPEEFTKLLTVGSITKE